MSDRNGTREGSRYHLLFFGGYDPAYPRNAIIRKGWRKLGLPLSECGTGMRRKVYTRYPALLWRYAGSGGKGRIIFVPDFRHKDVPLAWLLARISGRKLVFDPLVSRYETRVLDRGDAAHGSPQAWHNRNLDRISLRLPDLVLADTDVHADFFAGEFGVDRAVVRAVPVGFDEDIFKEAPVREGAGTCRVLFYGTYLPLHGVETIVEAAAILRGRKVVFTLVGTGQTHAGVKRRAEREGCGNIEFRLPVREDELAPLIAGADIVLGVFGSTLKAGMVVPNKVYQSLAVGRAVITADTPAVREHFKSGTHLLTVPPADPAALAGAVERLIDNVEARNRLAAQGGVFVRDRFNSVRVAERLAAVLEEARFV